MTDDVWSIAARDVVFPRVAVAVREIGVALREIVVAPVRSETPDFLATVVVVAARDTVDLDVLFDADAPPRDETDCTALRTVVLRSPDDFVVAIRCCGNAFFCLAILFPSRTAAPAKPMLSMVIHTNDRIFFISG